MDTDELTHNDPLGGGRPLALRAKLAAFGIMALVGFQLVLGGLVWSMPDEMEMLQMTDAELVALQARAEMLGSEVTLTLAALGLQLVAGVLFWMWMYRAYENLRALGFTPEHEPGRVVWCWLVPFANLVWPYQMMSEIWRKSRAHVDDLELDESEVLAAAPPLISAWWGAYIVRGFVDGFVGAGTPSTGGFALSVATDALAGALAVTLLLRLTARQEAALARGGHGAAPTTF